MSESFVLLCLSLVFLFISLRDIDKQKNKKNSQEGADPDVQA